MKKVLTLAFILISIGVNAQGPFTYGGDYEGDKLTKPSVLIPTVTLASTFVINHSQFTKGSNITPQIYITGAITSLGLHYGIKYIEDHVSFKRKRKYKKFKKNGK